MARLDDEIENKARRVKELELQADEEHKKAQQYNKEQRHEEAKQAYARMHALEDEASRLAKELGCVECVLGDPSCKASMELSEEFFELQPLPPWPVAPEGVSTAEYRQQVAARAEGAVAGSLLADAAAMGVHWVYDLTLLDQYKQERRQQQPQGPQTQAAQPEQAGTAVAGQQDADATERGLQGTTASTEEVVGLEFMQPPRSPFYTYASGRNSPYGEQTLVLLRSISHSQGLDCLQYASAFAQYFGDGFDGYRDVSTKGFLRNHARGLAPPATGASDAQANCIARAAPLAAGWAGHPELLARAVHCATRVTQNTDAAVVWAQSAAGILAAVLLGSAPSQATRDMIAQLEQAASSDGGNGNEEMVELRQEVAKQLGRALERAHISVNQAVAELGRNCHMPNACTTPLHAALHMEYIARLAHHANTGGHPTGVQRSASLDDPVPTLDDLVAIPWTADLAQAVGQRYVQGVRLAIAEGGCCASRASYTGALLGALAGQAGLPQDWAGQYTYWKDVCEAAGAICDTRHSKIL